MKKLAANLLIALLGGLISVGIYKIVEQPNNHQDQHSSAFQILPTKYNQPSNTTNSAPFSSKITQSPRSQNPKNLTLPAVDFTRTAAVSTPTVVHIKTKKVKNGSRSRNQNPFGSLFGDNFWYDAPQKKQQQKRQPQSKGRAEPFSTGSGVIIDKEGYIVTNNHVIDGADQIEVLLNDKRTYPATLVGRDPSTDLAVIKIEERNLPNISFGNSDQVQVGEWVMAVGNPFSLASTVTTGIVSAKARNINILEGQLAIESFIQTDAAVNPGNSGGALVNIAGELIGINTAIATPTGYYAGYAFAVPVNIVQKIVKDIIEYGEVKRGFLGVTIRDVDAEISRSLELPRIAGVLIQSVNKSGAAARAGLQRGDIVLKVAGISVNSSPELQEVVSRYRPGDRVPMVVYRDGKNNKAEVILKAAY